MAIEENIEAKLCAYIEGDLDAPGRAEIERYLASDPRHRALLEELKQDRLVLRGLVRVPAPPEIAEAFARQLERAALLGDDSLAEDRVRLRGQRWRQISAAAAILVLVGGLAAGVALILPSSGPKLISSALRPAPANAPSETEAPEAAQKQMPPDSSDQAKSLASAMVARNPADSPAKNSPPDNAANVDQARAPGQSPVEAGPPAGGGDQSSAAPQPTAMLSPALHSDDQATDLRGGRDMAMAAGALHEALGSAGQEPAAGGAIYLVLRTTDSDAQMQHIHAALNSASVQWMPLTPPGESTATTEPAAAAIERDRLAANSTPTTQPQSQLAEEANSQQLNQSNQQFVPAVAARMENNQNNASPGQVPATTMVLARALDRNRAEALAADLSAPSNQGIVGHDEFRALAPADVTIAGSAIAASAHAGAASPALLLVGQRITLVAQDPVVKDADAFHETQLIDGDGNVTIPVVGKVRAAGVLPADLERTINRAYNDASPPAHATWRVMPAAETPATNPSVSMTLATTAPFAGTPAAGGARPAVQPVDLVIIVHAVPPAAAPPILPPIQATSQPADAVQQPAPTPDVAPTPAEPPTTEPATSPS